MHWMDGAPTYTAQERAYQFLKNEISGGRLKSGELIDPLVIGKHLGISRIPVREALFRLISEGYLVALPNRRIIVTVLSPEKIEELFEIRAVLEGLAARRAAGVMDSRVLENLRFILQRMKLVERQPDAWLQLHADFHGILCERANYPELLSEIERLHLRVQPYLRLYYTAYARLEMKSAEHMTLIDAMQGGDGAFVESAVRDHILTAGKDLMKFVREFGVFEQTTSVVPD